MTTFGGDFTLTAMTKRINLLSLYLPFLLLALLSSQEVSAQSSYIPSLEGHILTFVKKDAKGEVTGYTKSTYSYRIGGEKDYKIVISTQEYDINMDPTSKPFIFDTEYVDGSPKEENMANLIKQIILEGVKSSTMENGGDDGESLNLKIDVEMDGKPFTVPDEAKVGTQFVGYTVKIKVSGMNVGSVGVSNIEVIDREDISIASTTTNCAVVQSTMTTKVVLKKVVNINKEWHSATLGVVKTEILDKKGRLQSSSELIAIEKIDQ